MNGPRHPEVPPQAASKDVEAGHHSETSMGAFVYMLRCADDALYIGCATGGDLARRIEEHQSGARPEAYTFFRRPVELIWSEHFPTITDAIAVERKLKGWSRAKKLALASGNWGSVQMLAKRPMVRGK